MVAERAWTPAIDVLRDDGHLVVRADFLGTKPEEIQIAVEDDILTVSSEHQESEKEKGTHYWQDLDLGGGTVSSTATRVSLRNEASSGSSSWYHIARASSRPGDHPTTGSRPSTAAPTISLALAARANDPACASAARDSGLPSYPTPRRSSCRARRGLAARPPARTCSDGEAVGCGCRCARALAPRVGSSRPPGDRGAPVR